MKKILFMLVTVVGIQTGTSAQKFYLKDNGTNIDKKVASALRYDYKLTSADSADLMIEVFFTGSYSIGKGYAGYYKLYDNKGTEIYKSKEWKSGGYGGVAENYIVKKVVKKDLPDALKIVLK